MKNFKKKYILMLSCLFLFAKAESQINYTVNVNSSDLSISQAKAIDNNNYSNVNITNLFTMGDIGKPALPVKYIKLYIPDGMDVNNISYTNSVATTFNLITPVCPIQKPVSINTMTQTYTKPDSTVYNSSLAYPSTMVNLVHNGFFNEKNRIITLMIMPFQYFPLTNKLNFYSTVNITVNLKPSSTKPINRVKTRSPYVKKMYTDILKSIVVNSNDIIADTASSLKKTILTTTNNIPYDYIIITDTSLVSSFSNFIDWKRRKGIYTGIISKQYIYNHYFSAGGDVLFTNHINDTSGCIRQFLYNAFQNGLGYALLAGDMTNMAVRKGWPHNNETDPAFIPETDMYFEDFETDWNSDGTSQYGEPSDYTTWHYPDIFVGRLICSTSSQVNNWTNNVLNYEQNPGNGSNSYLTKTFLIQADGMQEFQDAQTTASHLPSNFSDTIWGEIPDFGYYYDINGYVTDQGSYYGTLGGHKGADVIAEMNNNHFGFQGWFCHGGSGFGSANCYPNGQSTIQTMCGGDNDADHHYNWKLCAQEAHQYCKQYVVHETGNGLDDLTNSNYPSVIFAVSCFLTPYDVTSNINNGGAMNMGEAFTTLSNTGGAAFIGNTRDGEYGGMTDKMLWNFWDNIKQGGNSLNGFSVYHLGVAEELCKLTTNFSNNTQDDRFCDYSLNLIGCPETEIWTATPQNLSISTAPSDLTPNTSNTVTVTINNLPNGVPATVCLYKANDIFVTQDITGTGCPLTVTLSGVQPTSTGYLNITVTSHNYIPYQGTIPICNYSTTPLVVSSNETWNYPLVINSDLVINPGATLTINSSVYLKHDALFVVESGGTLIVNSSGHIYGGCDSSINALFSGTFSAVSGSTVTVNSW